MPKNQALQDFLTAKRAAITPEQAGLASSGARRVPGMRREEVALLTDFPARPEHDRNLLRWVATDPAARDLYLDWEEILAGLVGVLQLEASAAPADAHAQITTAGVAVG